MEDDQIQPDSQTNEPLADAGVVHNQLEQEVPVGDHHAVHNQDHMYQHDQGSQVQLKQGTVMLIICSHSDKLLIL